jgi:hypothetical protein
VYQTITVESWPEDHVPTLRTVISTPFNNYHLVPGNSTSRGPLEKNSFKWKYKTSSVSTEGVLVKSFLLKSTFN